MLNGRDLLEVLREEEVYLEDLTEAAFELYEGDESEEELREEFEEVVREYSEDENIFTLALSGLLVEEDDRVDLDGDPSFLISDELIGTQIAEYIGGKKAHFNFIRYDREKPGIISDLDPFTDDIVAGLIAGCMTKLFEDKIDD